MKAWWRVLRGVIPYKWSVIISMVCALGVGLSYASGVAVLLPVLKVFMTVEGMSGWTNRTVAEGRTGMTFVDLDSAMVFAQGNPVLRAKAIGSKATPELTDDPQVKAALGAKDLDQLTIKSVKVGNEDAVTNWQDMVKALAKAERNKPIDLEMTRIGSPVPFHVRYADLHAAPISVQALAWGVGLLPEDNNPHNKVVALSEIIGFFIVLCIIGSVFRYYQQFLGMTVANRVIMDLRRRVYDRVVQLPASYFARKGTSDVMSRLTSDAATLTDGVTMAFGKAIQEPVKAAGAFVGALLINWQLTLMIVASVPVLGLIINKFSKHMRKASRRAMENMSSILGIINETFIGVRVVKAYSAEGYERRRFSLANKKLLKQQRKLNHYNALSRPTIETLAVIVSSIPLLFAANWIFETHQPAQNILVLLAFFGAMLEPMRKLSDVNAKVQQTNAAATRVFEVLDMEKEPNTSHALPKLARHSKSIEFRNVTFSYPGHEEIVLKNINVLVKAGQNVAVVGGNGSGKTTLLQLLPRLYIPTSGQVLIDGVDTAAVSLRSLRKQIGLVTQDTLLFADTIYNNIAYGTRHAPREQVLKASRDAYADDFIKTLPEGYDTRVGEHGVRLSGGQKQRIAIARAILRNPAVLILDEAMSQIDADSETKITAALREFTRGRTTLMIAHRFQSVITADMIVCLDRGNVAGIGTHPELLESCLAYRRLYENQFREFDGPPDTQAA